MTIDKSFMKNQGIRPLFDDFVIVDWYDSMTIGVCRLADSNEWYLCSLYYFNPDERVRVFCVIEVSEKFYLEVRVLADSINHNQENYYQLLIKINNYFNAYEGSVYFIKAEKIDDKNYEVKEADKADKRYFSNVEQVIDETDTTLPIVTKYFKC